MEFLVAVYPLRIVNLVELFMMLMAFYGCFLLWPNTRFRGLSLVLALQAILMAFNFSEETGLFNQTYLITPIFSFCTGPVFYLFVSHLTYANHQWQKQHLVHFIPAIIALSLTSFTQWVLAFGSFSLLIYAVISYKMISRYNKAAQSLTSNDNMTRLSWLKRFMIIFGVLMVQDMFRVNMQPFISHDVLNTWYLLHQTAVMITYGVLIHLAIQQHELFNNLEIYDQIISKTSAQPEDNLDSKLFKQINELIVSQELFRQPRLSLADIANVTGLGIKDVSTVINLGASMNFSEYINRMRVNYFIEKHTIKTNILELAMEAGFNSKSSFNTLFKTFTEQTPSQYLKSLAAEKDNQ